MSLTPNSQQIGNLNGIASCCALLTQFQTAYAALFAQINAQNGGNSAAIWSAMATCAKNSDGTLGTPDGSPNTAHPIDNRVYPGLSRAESETTYSQAYGDLGTINTDISAFSQTFQALVGN